MARFANGECFSGGPVTAAVTRIHQGLDGCSAGVACWVAFCRCSLSLRLAVWAAEWMPGDGAA
jgi:hypothetical protein